MCWIFSSSAAVVQWCEPLGKTMMDLIQAITYTLLSVCLLICTSVLRARICVNGGELNQMP